MKANGFTLLEVLIALVIFSFGLLALAALMAKGLQYNTSALHRSYASTQAYDIADRMRANRLGITAGNYDSIPSGSGSVSKTGDTYTITVTWDDDRDGAADDNFVFQLQP
jgi:type IV pilus assembly protein PilV